MADRTFFYVGAIYLFYIYCCAKGMCPSGWEEGEGVSNVCFKVFRDQRSYEEHEISCSGKGGHLASIHSENELNAVTSLIGAGSGHFFIGLTDLSSEGTWTYSDSTSFDFDNWEIGEPNDLRGEDCVEMKNSGGWNDVSCSSRFGAVCKRDMCPSGWNEVATNPAACYKLLAVSHTYEEHEVSCRSDGGHLASIHSENELNAITSLIPNESGHYYIGLTDVSAEGNWTYSDSTPLDFHNWENGEPNNLGGEDCVEIKITGRWNDVACSSRFGAICKRERVIKTAKSKLPIDYGTEEHSESEDAPAENEFLTRYLTEDYNAFTTTGIEFVTEYGTEEYGGAYQNCPIGWFRFRSFCFFVETTKRMFRDAKTACRTRGGELASIHSEEEQAFVYSILKEDVQSYFIGLYFDAQTGTWNYTDNSALDYTNWYPTMPDGGEFENCVEMYFYLDGKWNDVSCFSPFNGAVCKATLGSYLLSGPLDEPERSMIECGNGWLNYYDESLYCFVDNFLQWDEASQRCADYGGHLVSIENKYENDFLREAMDNFDVEFIWIGMSDLHEEGLWRWENSGNIPSYTNWDYMEPNNFHNEDCAVMYFRWNFKLRRGAWYDTACCHEFPSICKKQL